MSEQREQAADDVISLATRVSPEVMRRFDEDCAANHRTRSSHLRWLIAERLRQLDAQQAHAAA